MNIDPSLSDPTPAASYAAPALPPPMPDSRKRKRKRVHWIVWVILCVSLLINFVTCSEFGSDFNVYGLDEFPAVSETLTWGSAHADTQIAVLKLEGVIMRESSSSLFGDTVDPVTKLLNEIRAVTVDTDYKAILLEVNSPGGGVTASDEIYQALMDFKASDPDRLILVHIRDMAASGGYYVAMAGDLLVGQPTSVVGSVGVIISAVNMHQLGTKIGLEDVSLTSSSNKALLNSLSPVDPEHQEILQKVVDQMYLRFRGLVLENRPFTSEYADEHHLLDGRIFDQQTALSFGMVDETGYLDHSRERLMSMLGVDEAAFYEINFSTGGWGGLFNVKTPEILAPIQPNSQFQYVWKP
ncbi:signal peptide peptidase SppA [Kiritimatiellota bacterium B12222]|nr:signal peptide peptidase SppA [Kiritimatiellota bacterium B12222]